MIITVVAVVMVKASLVEEVQMIAVRDHRMMVALGTVVRVPDLRLVGR